MNIMSNIPPSALLDVVHLDSNLTFSHSFALKHVIDKIQERNTFLEDTLSAAQHKLNRVDDRVDKLARQKVPAIVNHPIS
jgi:hypothetical protein